MAKSRNGKQIEKNLRLAGRGRALRASRLRRDNRPAISGLNPTAHERRGREQRSAIALKLLFSYLNCRPSNTVVKYSTEGGGNSLLGTKGGQFLKRSLFFKVVSTLIMSHFTLARLDF